MNARRLRAKLKRKAAMGDLDTALQALRSVQWLVDGADDIQCEVHLAALIGVVGDKFQDAMRALGWELPEEGRRRD